MQLKEDVTTTTAVTMVTTTTIVLIHVIVVARQHLHVKIEAHIVRDMPMKGNVTDTLVVLIHITTTTVQYLVISASNPTVLLLKSRMQIMLAAMVSIRYHLKLLHGGQNDLFMNM
jgi:tartrate dehydratase beta subunit/fumarate hydratase class I family protein